MHVLVFSPNILINRAASRLLILDLPESALYHTSVTPCMAAFHQRHGGDSIFVFHSYYLQGEEKLLCVVTFSKRNFHDIYVFQTCELLLSRTLVAGAKGLNWHVIGCHESSLKGSMFFQSLSLCANTWIQQMATLFLHHQNRLLGDLPVRYVCIGKPSKIKTAIKRECGR